MCQGSIFWFYWFINSFLSLASSKTLKNKRTTGAGAASGWPRRWIEWWSLDCWWSVVLSSTRGWRCYGQAGPILLTFSLSHWPLLAVVQLQLAESTVAPPSVPTRLPPTTLSACSLARFWLISHGLSANEQYFSLTPNQTTVLSAMAYKPN